MVTYTLAGWLTITEEVKQKYQKDDVVQASSLYDKDYAGYCKWGILPTLTTISSRYTPAYLVPLTARDEQLVYKCDPFGTILPEVARGLASI